MNNFTFLTTEQIFGDNQLEVFKKNGGNCQITDFAILLGGYISLNDGSNWWWTKTPYDDTKNNGARSSFCGINSWGLGNSRDGGARPILTYSTIADKAFNKIINTNDTLEVEYYEYPQDVVSEEINRILEVAYSNDTITKTGKKYTTDSIGCEEAEFAFHSRTHIEYSYNQKKYLRFKADSNGAGKKLSDGRTIQEGEIYWIEVKPLKWLIDKKADIAVSKKVIFSGIQFNKNNDYNGDFERTDIKKYLDEYFSKEVIPSILKELTPEEKIQIEKNKKEAERKRNPYNFDFDEVSEEDIIKGAIESNVPVFLHGPSSEGKSARIKQIDPDCIIIYLRNATPESLNGKSVYNSENGEMIDIKPTWLKRLEEKCEKAPDKYHLVFLDEITNALPSIQGIAFNIVLDREVNGIWHLPKNARLVAAGNEKKDSLAANQLAEPLFNRFAHVYIKTTTADWLKWAGEHNIHPAIYTYIAYTKGESLRSKYTGEKPNADPRKWEMASKMLFQTNNPQMLRSLIGEDITREFCQFCNQKVITLEDVLTENYTQEDLNMNTSTIYATLMGLSQVDEENFLKVREFISNLGAEFCAIFEQLWSKGDERRMEIIMETRLIAKKEKGVRIL